MAQIYYATSGNDGSGDGSLGNPYATPATALSNAATGDTVVGRAGTYSVADWNINGEHGGKVMVNYPGEEVVWQSGAGDAVLRPLSPWSNLTIDGITYDQGATNPLETVRIETAAVTENVVFRNVKQKLNAGFTGSRAFMRLRAPSRGLSIDGIEYDAGGDDFALIEQDGLVVAENITLKGMNVKGVGGAAVILQQVAGHCFFDGRVTGDFNGPLFDVRRAPSACQIAFGDLDVRNTNTASSSAGGISIGSTNAADTIRFAGGNLQGDAWGRAVVFEFGISGALARVSAIARATSGGSQALACRDDSPDSGTLSTRDLTIGEVFVDTKNGNALAHGLLLGRHSDRVTILSGSVQSSGYGIVLKGGNHRLYLDVEGGAHSCLYWKGSQGNQFSGSLRQADGGAVFHVEDDPDVSNRPSANNRVTGCDIDLIDGRLWDWEIAGDDTGGSVFDGNRYGLAEGATWGTLRGTAIASLANLQAAWAGYAAGNDGGSIEVTSDSAVAAGVGTLPDLTVAGAVNDVAATTGGFTVDGLPLATQNYVGMYLIFTAGVNRGLWREIDTSTGVAIVLKEVLPVAPSDNDAFVIGGKGC